MKPGCPGQVFAPDIQVDLLRRRTGLRVRAGGKGHDQQTGGQFHPGLLGALGRGVASPALPAPTMAIGSPFTFMLPVVMQGILTA